MKIVKIRENVTRSYVDNVEKEQIDSVSYELRDDKDARIGEFNAYTGGYNITINGTATDIAGSVAQVRTLFNITEEE